MHDLAKDGVSNLLSYEKQCDLFPNVFNFACRIPLRLEVLGDLSIPTFARPPSTVRLRACIPMRLDTTL